MSCVTCHMSKTEPKTPKSVRTKKIVKTFGKRIVFLGLLFWPNAFWPEVSSSYGSGRQRWGKIDSTQQTSQLVDWMGLRADSVKRELGTCDKQIHWFQHPKLDGEKEEKNILKKGFLVFSCLFFPKIDTNPIIICLGWL